MSLVKELADFLATELGVEVFTSQLPGKPKSDDNQWAVVPIGGAPAIGGNVLLWRQQNIIRVFYRHRSGEALYAADVALRAAVNDVVTLQTYRVLSAPTVSPMTDLDLDAEGRHVASWQIQVDTSIK